MSLNVKLRRIRKKPPAGWDLIEPTLEEFEAKMREAETDPHEGKRKSEAIWPIFRVGFVCNVSLFTCLDSSPALTLYLRFVLEGGENQPWTLSVLPGMPSWSTRIWWPSGRSRATRTCVAWDACKLETATSEPTVFAVCRKASWRRWVSLVPSSLIFADFRTESSSAYSAAVADARPNSLCQPTGLFIVTTVL